MKNYLSKLYDRTKSNKFELLFLGILLAISGIAAGWNMFHYPSYFDDEGTYMARAIAIAYHHSLSPYTYWYDHAPGGTIILAIWLRLTGGISTFGSAINSGRVLMLLAHLMSTVLLYLIARHFKLKKFFIAVIVLMFSLSPLAVTLQRMVLLDNLMVLAVLFSLYLLLHIKNIYLAIVSGMLLGLSVLIKESAIFFIPGMLILLFQIKPRHHRKFTSITWLSGAIGTIIIYPIFALLRGELFPMNSFLGGKSPHVSLITSLAWQSSRRGGAFYSHSSQFYYSLVHSWLFADPILITIGFFASLSILILSFWKRQYLAIAVLTFGYIFYLLRGGIINDQYLTPLIPFFALNIGLAFSELYCFTKKKNILKTMAIIIVASTCSLTLFWDAKNPDLYVLDATTPQVNAINWVQKNTTKSYLTEIDSYAQPTLLYTYGSKMYKSYGYQDFWEVDQDPELTAKILHNNWRTINYLLVTPRMITDVSLGGLPLTQEALKNSNIVKQFTIVDPKSGISGFLYRNSYHRGILIATTNYVEIKKVN